MFLIKNIYFKFFNKKCVIFPFVVYYQKHYLNGPLSGKTSFESEQFRNRKSAMRFIRIFEKGFSESFDWNSGMQFIASSFFVEERLAP